MKIIHITKSKKKDKRFKVLLDNGDEYNFGLKDGKTYIDEQNKDKRYLYWVRHYGNETERERIDNFTPSASLFSAYLLWGKYTNIEDNIKWLNNKL